MELKKHIHEISGLLYSTLWYNSVRGPILPDSAGPDPISVLFSLCSDIFIRDAKYSQFLYYNNYNIGDYYDFVNINITYVTH